MDRIQRTCREHISSRSCCTLARHLTFWYFGSTSKPLGAEAPQQGRVARTHAWLAWMASCICPGLQHLEHKDSCWKLQWLSFKVLGAAVGEAICQTCGHHCCPCMLAFISCCSISTACRAFRAAMDTCHPEPKNKPGGGMVCRERLSAPGDTCCDHAVRPGESLPDPQLGSWQPQMEAPQTQR